MRSWIEKILILAGMAGLGVWLWSIASTAVFQDWQHWVFDRKLRGEPANLTEYLSEKRETIAGRLREWWGGPAASTPPGSPKASIPSPPITPPAERPPSVEENGLIGRLEIPRLHLGAMVRQGVGEDTLRLALGHIPSTSLPGQNGNVGVAGHRDTLFRGLRGIHKDDLILFETLAGKYTYQVESTQIVKPQDVSVLNAGEHPELTLVTCYPFYYVGSAPDRFIVKARQVPQAPTEQESAKIQPETPEPAVAPPAPLAPAIAPPDPPAPPPARVEKVVKRKPASRRLTFWVSERHSRELAPGISFGLSGTDAARHRANGWIWLVHDRRTIWLRDQNVREPVIFYGHRDGIKRELVITHITRSSVSGYLLLPGAS